MYFTTIKHSFLSNIFTHFYMLPIQNYILENFKFRIDKYPHLFLSFYTRKIFEHGNIPQTIILLFPDLELI